MTNISPKTVRRNRAIVAEARNVPCTRCGGEFHHAAMEFHHRDGRGDRRHISSCIHLSEARLREELALCDVVCANCHRIIEWELGDISSLDGVPSSAEEEYS